MQKANCLYFSPCFYITILPEELEDLGPVPSSTQHMPLLLVWMDNRLGQMHS